MRDSRRQATYAARPARTRAARAMGLASRVSTTTCPFLVPRPPDPTAGPRSHANQGRAAVSGDCPDRDCPRVAGSGGVGHTGSATVSTPVLELDLPQPWTAGRGREYRGGEAARGLLDPEGAAMLNDSKVTANVPASDLDRARRFYADMLGLTPADENPGGLVYTTEAGRRSSSTRPSTPARPATPSRSGTSADVADEVRDLKAKGLAVRALRHARRDLGRRRRDAWRGWAARPGSRTARATSCASTTTPTPEHDAGLLSCRW